MGEQGLDLGSGSRLRGFAERFPQGCDAEFYNESGQVVLAYRLFRCWPSLFEALPDLDANGAAVAIQTLVLENEGWERDLSVVEPVEPSFNGVS